MCVIRGRAGPPGSIVHNITLIQEVFFLSQLKNVSSWSCDNNYTSWAGPPGSLVHNITLIQEVLFSSTAQTRELVITRQQLYIWAGPPGSIVQNITLIQEVFLLLPQLKTVSLWPRDNNFTSCIKLHFQKFKLGFQNNNQKEQKTQCAVRNYTLIINSQNNDFQY